jgi:hypothetical protein
LKSLLKQLAIVLPLCSALAIPLAHAGGSRIAPAGSCIGGGSMTIPTVTTECVAMGGQVANSTAWGWSDCTLDLCATGPYAFATPGTCSARVNYGVVYTTGADCRALGGAMNGTPGDTEWTSCHLDICVDGPLVLGPADFTRQKAYGVVDASFFECALVGGAMAATHAITQDCHLGVFHVDTLADLGSSATDAVQFPGSFGSSLGNCVGDLERIDSYRTHEVGGATQCEAYCHASEDCVAYEYTPAYTDCYVFRGDRHSITGDGAEGTVCHISDAFEGVQVREEDKQPPYVTTQGDCSGESNAIDSKRVAQGGIAECQSWCDATQGCSAYEFTADGADCYIFSGQATGDGDEGVTCSARTLTNKNPDAYGYYLGDCIGGEKIESMRVHEVGGVTECKAFCDATRECVAYEYTPHYTDCYLFSGDADHIVGDRDDGTACYVSDKFTGEKLRR